MYGITTIQKLNAQNREAEEILAKREREDAVRKSIAQFEAAKNKSVSGQPVAA